jgi:hypothetical protein
LGIDLDDRLTFDINIEEICKKICSGIGALRRIKPFVPQTSLVTLYKSLIQPYFDYCSPLWDTCDKILKDKLQILQNRAVSVENRKVDGEGLPGVMRVNTRIGKENRGTNVT